MGLINWAADKVKDKAKEYAKEKIKGFVYDKAFEYVEKEHSTENVIKDCNTYKRLFVVENRKHNYIVSDESETVKYTIKIENIKSDKPYAIIYNAVEKEIGKVVLENTPNFKKYYVYADGNELGYLNRIDYFGLAYKTSFNDWRIELFLSQFKICVTDAHGNILIKINWCIDEKITYVVGYNDDENELNSLFVLLSTYILHSKKKR